MNVQASDIDEGLEPAVRGQLDVEKDDESEGQDHGKDGILGGEVGADDQNYSRSLGEDVDGRVVLAVATERD